MSFTLDIKEVLLDRIIDLARVAGRLDAEARAADERLSSSNHFAMVPEFRNAASRLREEVIEADRKLLAAKANFMQTNVDYDK